MSGGPLKEMPEKRTHASQFHVYTLYKRKPRDFTFSTPHIKVFSSSIMRDAENLRNFPVLLAKLRNPNFSAHARTPYLLNGSGVQFSFRKIVSSF